MSWTIEQECDHLRAEVVQAHCELDDARYELIALQSDYDDLRERLADIERGIYTLPEVLALTT